MKRDQFWNIVDEAVATSGEIANVPQVVQQLLLNYEPEEIVSFKQHIHQLLAEAYRWDLWAMGYIVNGGCSDDGFCYFCCWLIANGSERFLAAAENPKSIGDWAEPEEAELEEFMYAPLDAYRTKTGNDFPWDSIDCSLPDEPAGASWDEDELEALYPELCARYF